MSNDENETTAIPAQKLCAVSGCDRSHYAKTLCRRHYQQMARGKGRRTVSDIISKPADRFQPETPRCSAPGCDRTRVNSEYCGLHYSRSIADPFERPTTCSVDGCSNKPRTRGMCNTHYQAWYRENLDESGRLKVAATK